MAGGRGERTKLVGNAVRDDVVDASAAGLGEAEVEQWRGVRVVGDDVVVYPRVDVLSRYTHLIQRNEIRTQSQQRV